MSYLKHSSWRRMSKLLSNFGCLFTFCYLDGANSIKTDLHICNYVNPKRYLTIISSCVNSVGEFGCQYASLTRSAGLLINLCKPSAGPFFNYVRQKEGVKKN